MRKLRWLLAAALLAVGLTVAGAGPLAATALAPVQTETVGDTFTVSATLVTIVLGIVAPLATGVLVRPTNPGWVKLLVAGLVATAFNAFHQAVQADGSAVLSGPWFLSLALLLATQFGTYFHVWQPVTGGELNRKLGPGVINVTSRDTTQGGIP